MDELIMSFSGKGTLFYSPRHPSYLCVQIGHQMTTGHWKSQIYPLPKVPCGRLVLGILIPIMQDL